MARDGMGRYDEAVDNISAYEVLTDTMEHEAKAAQLAAERAQLEKDKGKRWQSSRQNCRNPP